MMMNSSIRLWFVGGAVGWMMKISSPRTFSSIFTNVSPSGNGVIVILPSSRPMDLQMARARGSFAVPEKTFTDKKDFGLKNKNRRNRRNETERNFNNELGWRKTKLKGRRDWSVSSKCDSRWQRHFIGTGLQPGVGWVWEPQPFQRLYSPVWKPLKRLKWLGHHTSPG